MSGMSTYRRVSKAMSSKEALTIVSRPFEAGVEFPQRLCTLPSRPAAVPATLLSAVPVFLFETNKKIVRTRQHGLKNHVL